MYIAVCDDQIEELEKLTALLQAWQSDLHSDVRFQTFRSGGQLLDAARAERFTLYLLDVLMPGMTGMDAAREIRSFDAAADIIFLTTSPGFAYESYGVRAAEYLLKPINAKLLYPVLDKLYLRDQKPQDGLTVKSNGMLVRLPFSQLSYVEVNGKHLFFNMADGTVHEVAAAMREYEGALLLFGSLPVTYYIFDYATTIYSDALYSGIQALNEFLPTVLITFYVLFLPAFHLQSQRQGAVLTVDASLPNDVAISDTELCSLLSNGLENALHAVADLPADRKQISLYCGVRQNKLLIEIRNPCAGPIAMRDGLPISDREGHGYGCRSIQAIAQRNGGLCVFSAQQGQFLLQIMLPVLET